MTSFTQHGWTHPPEICDYQGSRGPRLFSAHPYHITNAARTLPHIHIKSWRAPTTTTTTTSGVSRGKKGHFCCDCYSARVESAFCQHSAAAAQNASQKWNPITLAVMLIICYGVINNQRRPFVTPTSLSGSRHSTKQETWVCWLWMASTVRRRVWFIVCCAWKNGTAVHLLLPAAFRQG